MRSSKSRWLLVAVLLGVLSAAHAGDIKSGDWSWDVDDPEALNALTSNSAANLLAQFCYPEKGNCLYAVAFGMTCEEGEKYPALVNTDKGSRSIELVCGPKFSDENLMLISEFDVIDKLVRQGKRIGFVMPMQGDEFKAVRFSLQGATQALDLMRRSAEKLHAKRNDGPSMKPAVERL